MNHTQNCQNGKILLVAVGCAALLTSLTAPFTLAQSDADPAVAPGDAQAIEAAAQALPVSSSTMLDALSDTARAEVERICLPVQYQSGVVAYRECISEQLDGQPSTSSPAVPDTALSFDEEFAIQQFCQGAGPVDSTDYRACDEEQLASLAGIPEPALERITEDETYAVQLGCYDIQTNNGVRAYRECLNETIGQLLELPRPDLSTLTLVNRNALQLRCSAQNNGAVAYRNCLLDAVDGATMAQQSVDEPGIQNETEPPVEPAAEPSVDPSGQTATQAEATATPEIADTSDELQPVPPVDSETATNDSAPVEADPAVTTEAIQLPTTAIRNPDDTTEGTAVQSETSDEADSSGQAPADLLTRLRSNIASMSDMNRMLMWAALTLPILLTLSWLYLRGRKPAPESRETHPENLVSNGVDTAPYRPSTTRRTKMSNDDTAEFATPNSQFGRQNGLSTSVEDDDDDVLKFSAQMDELFGKPEPDGGAAFVKDTGKDLDTAVESLLNADSRRQSEASPAPISTLDIDLPAEKGPSIELTPLADYTLASATERNDYHAWFSDQDEAKQQTLAIEFLIYWMAYSDERYPPELKQKILQLQSPGDHELIKRWTILQNIHAFAGNLQWLQYNLSTEQHEQIINLLMALLVSENALTPAQNTLLRFLADAFGLGAERLDKLYQAGFAHPLPKLPRLDNPGWWKRQSSDTLKRWDARSVSRQRSEIRYRVALGLPLEGELDQESIKSSFRRAAKRCQPERFNQLSSRERTLVARQLEKYEVAAESLLEVSA